MTRSARLLAAATLTLAVGCATAPKPVELEAFEKLRADPAANAAAKRNPDLVKTADRWLAQSRQHWQSNDIEQSAHEAQMGQIKLKQAIAMYDLERAKARIENADDETQRASDEQGRLQRELASLNTQVGLMERINQQSTDRRKLEEQLEAEKKLSETERQKTATVERIAEAELALKSADSVNAAKHAAAVYAAAKDLLARAQQELQQSSFQAAQLSADMAKKKSDEAALAAKPAYQQEAESAESRGRAEALAREAAAISRLMVRRDTRGSLQRLVLPIPAEFLFNRRDTFIASGRDAILDSIAALIKKYPSFPVQVLGYTDSRGRSSELLALSHSRAQAVHQALIQRGVDGKRLVFSGNGAAEPVSDNRTTNGRAQNNRVEIIFLYQ